MIYTNASLVTQFPPEKLQAGKSKTTTGIRRRDLPSGSPGSAQGLVGQVVGEAILGTRNVANPK
jgi:hypothetical protein